MKVARFKIVLVMLALVSCRIVSAGPEQESGKVVSVKEFGAKGDGVADDTAAIQAAIDAATNGATIKFPSGTYVVSNFVVKNRSGLSFVGEGRNSLIKQKAGAQRIATFTGSRNIVIAKLAFDANGIKSYGGVAFYAVTGVRIENNLFIDSNPKPVGGTDRYSFVFGKSAESSRDIKILDNVIEDLQLEVNHSRHVLIERNTVSRAVNTAGIGIFTVGDNAIAEDYLIRGNTVIDPMETGFNVGIDPPNSRNCIFRRITIINNTVIRTKTGGYGIRIGTPDNSKATTGNVFEDIVIKGNLVQIETAVPQSRSMIFANSSTRAGILFQRVTVTGNTMENNGPKHKGYAIDLRRIQNSIVADNMVKGVANGIALSGGLLANEVRNNTVHATEVAYKLDGSLGENRVTNNRVVGNPREKIKASNMKSSDAVEK